MLRIVPIELKDANTLIATWHRHHKPVVGHRFSIGVSDNDGVIHGASVVGRPVARVLDYHRILEVTRLVTDGTRNACSILYAASARIGRELGYELIQTYILESESGTSLEAAGWECVGYAGGGDGWQSRPNRRDDQPTERKLRWIKVLNVVKCPSPSIG